MFIIIRKVIIKVKFFVFYFLFFFISRILINVYKIYKDVSRIVENKRVGNINLSANKMIKTLETERKGKNTNSFILF